MSRVEGPKSTFENDVFPAFQGWGIYITPLRYNSLPLKKDWIARRPGFLLGPGKFSGTLAVKLPGSSSSFGGYALPMLMIETSPLRFLMGFHGRSLIALFQHGCPSFSVEGSNFGCEDYTPDKNWPGPQKCSLSAGAKLLCLYKTRFSWDSSRLHGK